MIPQDFYREETRCDFLVTEKRKKVWAVELKMLNSFKAICDKYGLKYFAIGGTLLGAARHKGFIPWDDDIDVGMPRADFEKFLFVANLELAGKSNLIIQYETFDKNYSTPHARITNIKTTAFFPHMWKSGLDVPQGIFIDIFPYDNVPNNKWKKNVHRFVYKSVAYMLHDKQNLYTYKTPSFTAKILRISSRCLFLFSNVDAVFRWTQKYIQKYNSDTSCERFGCISSFYRIEKVFMRRDWFDETIELPFENTYISCPKAYKEALTCQYGNWEKWVKAGTLHEGCFFDPDKSYTVYKNVNIVNIPNTL